PRSAGRSARTRATGTSPPSSPAVQTRSSGYFPCSQAYGAKRATGVRPRLLGVERLAPGTPVRAVPVMNPSKGERPMNRRSWRLGVAALALVLVGTVALQASTASKRLAPTGNASAKSEGDMPAALGRHLEQLGESLPGNGGEPAMTDSQGPSASAAGM